MEQTLKLKTNLDHIVTLRYDQPKTGTNNYGDWFLYGVIHEGEEKGLFATSYLNDKLKFYGEGDVLNIRKEEVGGKIQWNVIPQEGTDVKRDRGKSAGTNGVPVSTPTKAISMDDRTKDIHKQVCLKLAVQSMPPVESFSADAYEEVDFRMNKFLEILDG